MIPTLLALDSGKDGSGTSRPGEGAFARSECLSCNGLESCTTCGGAKRREE